MMMLAANLHVDEQMEREKLCVICCSSDGDHWVGDLWACEFCDDRAEEMIAEIWSEQQEQVSRVTAC